MAEIEITIRADETALRWFAEGHSECSTDGWLARAVGAGLPAVMIEPRPGMLLLQKSHMRRVLVVQGPDSLMLASEDGARWPIHGRLYESGYEVILGDDEVRLS